MQQSSEPLPASQMDFEHFLGLCGRSLFTEEYRGDLDAAWDYLQQHRLDASDAEPSARAEYLRCSSVFSILTGRLGDAYTHLAALHDLLACLPQEWGLRYTNYKVLADCTRRFPPALRFYHERSKPVNIGMLRDIVGPNEISQRFMENVQKYLAAGTLRDQGLCQILGAVQWFPMQVRNLAHRLHPLSPGGSRYEPDADPASAIAEMSKNYLKFRDLAETNGALGLAVYLSRLVVELCLVCQGPDSAIYIEELYRRCERLNDKAGMASCKMMEGDSLCSPAFASPISLNLIIVDVYSSVGDDALWDPIESDLTSDYSNQAQQCYASALLLFCDADCKRGQAAVLLRQACCLHNVARQRRVANQPYVNVLGESETMLQESLRLFGRDEASLQIVKAHQILVGIAKGNPQQAKTTAKGIGQWCAQARNEALAHFIGLVMSRFAHQEWFKFSNMDTALLSWECAHEVFKGVDDIVPSFQTIVSRAWMQHEMFNMAVSKSLIEEALSMVDEIRAYFDDRIQSAPDTRLGQIDRATLTTSKCHLLLTFNQTMGLIFLRVEDLQSFHEWHAKLAHLFETDESFRDYQARLQDPATVSVVKPVLQFSDNKTKGLWRKSIADEAAKVRYGSSMIAFRRLLDEGEVLKAEETLRLFVDDVGQLEKLYTRDLYCILACARVGNTARARVILDSIDDNELFDGDLESFQQGIGVRSTFPTVAQNALAFSILGGDLDRGRRIIEIITKIFPTYFEEANDNFLEFSYRLSYWGIIMKDIQPEACLPKLLLARRIVETRRQQTADLDARIGNSMSGPIAEIYINLAHLCICYSKSNTPLRVMSEYDHGNFDDISWLEHALLFVEMGRARAVLEALQSQAHRGQGKPEVPKTAPLSEAVHKRRLLRSLLALQSLTPEQAKELSQLKEDIETLEQDGALSSATTFIETTNSTIEPRLLYQSVDENAVLIEATFGSHGVVAFAVTRDGIQQTHQGMKSDIDMRRPVMMAMKLMREMKGYIGEAEEARKNQLKELSQDISNVLLVPFAETIRAKSHVIFSVSHPLTAFPFSVLMFDGKPLIEHAAISQVPSLTVLYYLSQRKSASVAPTVSVLAKAPTETPLEDAMTRDDKEDNLHMAGIEAVNIARMFATWPIEASNLSRSDFREQVEGGSLVMHIGTHGVINVRNPLLSSISIGKGQEFRVADMAAIQSNVNLLVFAACLSGFGKATIGSEVLGFSHVVLSTGCQAYIGSLWKVSDFGSMLIMTLFYQYLRNHPSWSVAEIMRAAQMDIMQLDSEKASRFLDDMLTNWTSSNEEGQRPVDFVPDAGYLLLTLRMILDQLDWSSPFYWAPFTLVGYGGFHFMHS
ncbi:uncharacterized protein N7459_008294 [Penicillium hispanicum]|uniref:uncharacterized protein n=1 Tax=Penicillium hispanicum TaxID=1080232 RepID=UPI0025411EE0|nr:uncharacterized protein N7459_008294 [Penicillium hispanicum]KAJ5573867.1 hypothetical protein N7459_008294 [Penicillium hispanicum]